MKAYQLLEQTFARVAAIEDAVGLLRWDSEVMMPKGSASERSSGIAALQGIAHELLSGGEIETLLVSAEQDSATLDDWQRSNLREMRRAHQQESAVPRELVEANSKAVLEATLAWRDARAKSDFALLQGPLAKVAESQRAIGEARGAFLCMAPYDALLDSFDPGSRQDKIDPIFNELTAAIPDLMAAASRRQARQPAAEPLKGPFPIGAQQQLNEELMRVIGFDFERGRIDVSRQPFCGGANGDVRITACYDDSDFLKSLTALFHECGHALYEQGRPPDYLRQPVGKARGLTLHESQALFMEMQVCSTREFVSFMAPRVRAVFGGTGAAWSADNIHRVMTRVEPSLIRMDADEMTYVLHAIIRYDLEKAMIAGDLPVADLPGAYDEAVRRVLGLKVPNDQMGCLQDIHWAAGFWGYFPSYVLGAIVAAQLFESACKVGGDALSALADGDFSPVREWLRENIHSRGSLLESDELILAATGRLPETGAYRSYLRARYVDGD